MTMRLHIELSIVGVDGETHFIMHSPSAERVLAFLRERDHEGSVVTVHLTAEDESAYQLLALIPAE